MPAIAVSAVDHRRRRGGRCDRAARNCSTSTSPAVRACRSCSPKAKPQSIADVRKAVAELPDVAVSSVGEDGLEFKIDTSDREIAHVQTVLKKTFGDALKTYSMSLRRAGQDRTGRGRHRPNRRAAEPPTAGRRDASAEPADRNASRGRNAGRAHAGRQKRRRRTRRRPDGSRRPNRDARGPRRPQPASRISRSPRVSAVRSDSRRYLQEEQPATGRPPNRPRSTRGRRRQRRTSRRSPAERSPRSRSPGRGTGRRSSSRRRRSSRRSRPSRRWRTEPPTLTADAADPAIRWSVARVSS